MIDYSELEKKLKNFRKNLISYKKIWSDLLTDLNRKELKEKEEKLHSKLTQTYGALAGYIHGMAGYVKKIYAGIQVDIFMTALLPYQYVEEKQWAIEASIQCLDKAIGGCQYAKSVEKKSDQIIIHKGGYLDGWLIIIRILRESKKKIFIRDRYLNEEIFSIIEGLNPKIDINLLIQKEPYKEKSTLKLIYSKYRRSKNNVEIRELAKKQFHSREIIVDENKGYDLTFSIKDVGHTEGRIHMIKRSHLPNTIVDFNKDWKLATKI